MSSVPNPAGYTYNGVSGLTTYGPKATCTLALCPVEWSVYQYRPSLAANISFLVIFFALGIAHSVHGFRYREYTWTISMILGCLSEIIGYIGRILLWQNPFSFTGFMIQICCITFAPVFFCAAIYILLARLTASLDPTLSRLPPKFWYWIFLPCDLVSLILQASGGAMSSVSTGASSAALNISIAGLSFQVITLFLFSVGVVDYAVRYARKPGRPKTTRGFKVFATCLAMAVVFIFIRCAYRIQELRKGYHSDLMADQGLFIALEGVMIVLAVVVLLGAMPGKELRPLEQAQRHGSADTAGSSDEEYGAKA